MAADFKTAQPIEFYKRFLNENVRPDGRALDEFRKTLLNVGSISTAEGSALIRLGNTSAICGIKAELAAPATETPNHGYIVPNVDLPPLCAPKFRPGPPSSQAQVLSQFMADVTKDCNLIKLEDLCIVEGKLCWCLYIDIVCLNYDGNITDTCLIALLAALQNTHLPKVHISEETSQVEVSEDLSESLKINCNPVSTTFTMFDNSYILVDPTDEEESLATGAITIVVLDDNQLCSIHKPGGGPIEDSVLKQCIKRALARGEEVRRLIETVTLPVER